MNIVELKAGLNQLLQTIYDPNVYKFYSMDVIEGYDRPCFFTRLKPTSNAPVNFNTRANRMTFYITYMAEVTDEAEAYDMIDKIRDLFGLSVKIGDRAVDVTEFEWDFVGSDYTIPQITIDLEWYDKIIHDVTDQIIESVQTNINMEEN